MENGKFIVNTPSVAGPAVTGFVPAKSYAAPGMKVVALSASARLCQQASVTIPSIEDGGEWPD